MAISLQTQTLTLHQVSRPAPYPPSFPFCVSCAAEPLSNVYAYLDAQFDVMVDCLMDANFMRAMRGLWRATVAALETALVPNDAKDGLSRAAAASLPAIINVSPQPCWWGEGVEREREGGQCRCG